jgi:hypothetical protein
MITFTYIYVNGLVQKFVNLRSKNLISYANLVEVMSSKKSCFEWKNCLAYWIDIYYILFNKIQSFGQKKDSFNDTLRLFAFRKDKKDF